MQVLIKQLTIVPEEAPWAVHTVPIISIRLVRPISVPIVAPGPVKHPISEAMGLVRPVSVSVRLVRSVSIRLGVRSIPIVASVRPAVELAPTGAPLRLR